VRDRGAAVLRRTDPALVDAAAETEAVIAALEARGLRVIGTHFGRVEDLRTDNTTNANTDQLGYTDAAIQLHTDQPFLDRPPRYQLLQSVRAADEGGANALVDALAAARHLRDLDRAAFDLLTGTPVTFHRRQQRFERTVVSPMLQGVDDGADFLVRYSYFTLSPYRLDFAEMEAWYRAVDRFARLVRDPRHQLQLALRPGEWILYDNHRMLHARTAFRGPRWVRGVYFDRA
ncbi:MAG: Gamma-butyrobetaine dioxygenase, partial [Myxococcaceae bacterium]|nr:Gamma-butyrobetaine dioxygenase [Myxococcaceae bacterium]